jgi:MFS transporter, DHA1 family, inner membrane transport protein
VSDEPDDVTEPDAEGESPEAASLRAVLALLAAVRLTVNTGHRFVYPFLPAIARGLGIPLEQAGLLVSARNLAGMATPLVVATAGRGERRRRVVVAGLALFAVGAAVTVATGLFVGALVGFILLGLGKPTFDVAAQAYLADRTPYRRRARVLATLELTWAGSLLLGAPAAGWLIERFGWEAPFWIVAALAGLSIVAVRRSLLPDAQQSSRPLPAPLRLDRSTTGLLLTLGITAFAAEVTFVVFGAWMETDFGLSLVALGVASTAIAVAELTGSASVAAFADRLGKRRSVALGITIATAGFATLGLADSLATGIGAFALGLLGFELTIVAAIPLASELRAGARTRFLALLVVAVGLGRTIGAAVGPLLFSAMGIAGPALVAAAGCVVGLVVLVATVDEP